LLHQKQFFVIQQIKLKCKFLKIFKNLHQSNFVACKLILKATIINIKLFINK
jgi:hypothetical protein